MKNYQYLSVFYITLLLSSTIVFSQELDANTVKSEILAAAMSEQNAFKSGNCEQVLYYMAENITFLANGKKVPSKNVIGKFCNSIPRPFKTAMSDKLVVYPLSETTGYVIRTLEYPKDEKYKMSEYVTKIWKKIGNEWKITHLHSTVKAVPLTK